MAVFNTPQKNRTGRREGEIGSDGIRGFLGFILYFFFFYFILFQFCFLYLVLFSFIYFILFLFNLYYKYPLWGYFLTTFNQHFILDSLDQFSIYFLSLRVRLGFSLSSLGVVLERESLDFHGVFERLKKQLCGTSSHLFNEHFLTFSHLYFLLNSQFFLFVY